MRVSKFPSGFSLVGVLVASAILGVLALTFSKYLTNAMKGQQFVQNAVDFDILKTSINMVLGTKACDGAFRDASGSLLTLAYSPNPSPGTNIISSPVSVAKIHQGSSIVADLSNPNLGGGLTLSKMEITDAVYDGTQLSGGTSYNAFVAVLNVTAQKAQGALGGSGGFQKSFSVRLLLRPNATGGIVEKCGSSGSKKKRLLSWVDTSEQGTGVANAITFEPEISSEEQSEGSIILVGGAGVYEDRLDFLFDPETGTLSYTRTGYHCNQHGSVSILDTDHQVLSNFANCTNTNPDSAYGNYTLRYISATQKLRMTVRRGWYGGPTAFRVLTY